MLATLTGLWGQGQERPNVLIAFADDWGRFASAYQDQGPYSGLNRLLSTPTFDRVAQEGVLFQNAFVTAPSSLHVAVLFFGSVFWRTGQEPSCRSDGMLPFLPSPSCLERQVTI